MTTPVASSNSSFYDPNAQLSSTEGYVPASGSSGPATEAPREITIPPTLITGSGYAAPAEAA
jgi:hypothetical protein